MGPSGIGKSSLLRPGWVENLLLQLALCFAISIFDVILISAWFHLSGMFPRPPNTQTLWYDLIHELELFTTQTTGRIDR